MTCQRTSLFGLLGLLCACGIAEVTKEERSEIDRLEEQYNAWASRQPRPSEQVVEHVEKLLSKEPCVEQLNGWSRAYAFDYDPPTKTLDQQIIAFHLEEAGKFGIRPGRRVSGPNEWVNLDDRPIRIAEGDYDIRDGKIRFAICGHNVPSTKSSAAQIDAYFDDLDRRRRNR